MLEFSSISVSSYDAASLADRLTEKSAQGWELVAIVPAGTNVTAYLSRPADGDEAPATSAGDDDISFTIGATTAAASSGEPATAAAITTPEAAAANAALAETDYSTVVSEPAGWGSEPVSRDTEPEHGGDSATDAVTTADVAAADVAPVTTSAATEVVDVAPAEPAQQAAAAAAAAPAGWYADPAGRYELRYWDGGQWTEHVSRAGQQFTDPPVA